MAEVVIARRRHRNAARRIPRERIYRRRVSLFDFTDSEVIRRYRLPPQAILDLLDEIKDDIEPATQRSHAVPGIVKLLATLQVLASGSFQTPIAGGSGIAQSSISRAMWDVIPAILRRAAGYITFPRARRDIEETKRGFFDTAGFPNVMGAIDCTHIALVPPGENEHVFGNRKHTYSVNVQVVCNASNVITDVVAKFPGSVHDSYILRNSGLFQTMQAIYGNTWLLGDGGYQLLPWLMTPVRNPANVGEAAYNRAHIRMRGVIERTFGLLKMRFRCLDRTGGAMLYSPPRVCQIVVVCCILHNILTRAGVPIDVDLPMDVDLHPGENGDEDPDRQEPPAAHLPHGQAVEGRNVRQNLVNHYFT